ncbi:MAG: DUF3108 domain-containing protein [Sphingobacteriia bacterium]|nr:DUF3108 domain-containing protein [Sphingobacteriia bacterium]
MKSMIKRISVLASLLVIFMASDTLAQECTYFYPTTQGTSLEYTFYNRKDKESSKQLQKVVKSRQEDGATVLTIQASQKDKRAEKAVETTFEVKCDEGKFYMNMSDFASAFNYQQYQNQPNMSVDIQSEGLYYPSNLSVGQTLPEGKVQIDIAANGINMFGTTVSVINRKVEGKETIETPAGKFECLKISADVITKSAVNSENKTIQWLAEGVGLVKSENRSKDGKLISYQLLTKIGE